MAADDADFEKIPLSMQHMEANDPPIIVAKINEILEAIEQDGRKAYYAYVNDGDELADAAGFDSDLMGEALAIDLHASASLVARDILNVTRLHGKWELVELLKKKHDLRMGITELPPEPVRLTRENCATIVMNEEWLAQEAAYDPAKEYEQERSLQIALGLHDSDRVELIERMNPALGAALNNSLIVDEMILRAARSVAKQEWADNHEIDDSKLLLEMMGKWLETATLDVPRGGGKQSWVER